MSLPTTTPGAGPPTKGDTTLVVLARSSTRPPFNSRQDTDARTAICRGLKEYLEQLSTKDTMGRELRFAQVFDAWPDWEKVAKYPSAAIYSEEAGAYDKSSFTPSQPRTENATPDGRWVVKTSELVLSALLLEVWTTEIADRKHLVAMLENALNPVDWRYGFLLQLPHYFNARAEFEVVSSRYVDDALRAGQRYRNVQFVLSARVDVLRLSTEPLARPKINVVVTAGSSPVG